MKSFSATGLAFVPEFVRRGLARPLHFALSYDEEIGCIGVRRLIDDIVARGVKPLGCIVGEPTGMELVVAHKGKKSWRCRVRGHEAHSSLTPHGVNAVQIACEIVTYLTNVARAFRDQGDFDDAYDVPYTTVHTGVIRGGTALNIVPRDCHFDFEIRHLPFDDPDELFAEVKAYARALPARDAQGRRGHLHRVRRRFRRCPASTRTANRRSRRSAGPATGPAITARSRSAPRRACSTAPRSPRSSAARATSRRRISRTNGSRSTSSRAARRSCERLVDRVCAGVTPSLPPIEVDFPDLARWATGNAGIPYVWTFAGAARRSARPAAGADARQRGLRRDRARLAARARTSARSRGTLSVCFANIAAYEAFDPADPFASRCVDEDFNRLWTAEVLDGPRQTRRPRARARAAARCTIASTTCSTCTR